jgi:hypothetical protein
VDLVDYVRWDKDGAGRCMPRKQDPAQEQVDWWWRNQRLQTLADLIKDRWDRTVKRTEFVGTGPSRLPAEPAKAFSRWPNRLRELVDQYLRFATSPYVDPEILIGAAAKDFTDYVAWGDQRERASWYDKQVAAFQVKVANHMREFVERASAWRLEWASGSPATERAKRPDDVVDVYTPDGVLIAQRVLRCDARQLSSETGLLPGSPCVTTLAQKQTSRGTRGEFVPRTELGLPGAELRVAYQGASGHLGVAPVILRAPGEAALRVRGIPEPRFDVVDEANRVLERGLPLCDARRPVTQPCVRLPLDGRPLSSGTTIVRPGGRQATSITNLAASTRIFLRPVGARQSNPGGARASLAQLRALHGQR